MPDPKNASVSPRLANAALALTLLCILTACGGGSTTTAPPGGVAATGAGAAALPAGVVVKPTFHMAAVIPPPPSGIDVGGTNASASQPPVTVPLSAAAASIDTARLTPDSLAAQLQAQQAGGGLSGLRIRAESAVTANAGIAPASTSVYTPAQIRAAYGLPALPAAGASLTAAGAAALGAGQTIYIVDANDNPNAFADLNTFSTTFGLPTCTKLTVTPSTTLPLAAPPSGCQLVIAYSNASGTANAGPPPYDAGWASEIALDVQWSHAIAPLARIVLIEAGSASLADLLGGVTLGNQMGPGVLSMSFGGGEGSWVPSVDSYFSAKGMTYLASTGDAGAGVSWPAVSNNVIAVGGTSLNYGGSGSRSESAWSGSGGGISAYEPLPAYQKGVSIAGGGVLASRAVADVSFNADPNTGQYVIITPPGGGASWYVYGGTSISSPQWAGVLALVNANRALNGQATVGDVHGPLYAQVAEVPGNYATAFDDVTTGSDGSCATCNAAAGYDQATGWGTPNVANLLPLLSGAQNTPPLPAGAMPGGVEGVAYALAWAPADAGHNALTYTVSGAPGGLTVASNGAVSWPHPVAGSYSFSVTVRDTADLSATGTESLTIIKAPAAPTVPGASFLVQTGSALSRSLGVTVPANSGTITYATANAPAGLTVSSSGVLTWAKAVAGRYSVTVTATNAYGASASGVYAFSVIAELPPVFSGTTSYYGPAGTAMSATLNVSVPNGGTASLALGGAPAGVTLSSAGVLAWAKPVTGSYLVQVTATDSYGYSASTPFKLLIDGTPVVTGATLTGNTGAALSVQAAAKDPIGNALAFSLSGAPAGLSISGSGLLSWGTPVAGVYNFTVSARNAAGLTGSAPFKLTVYGQPVVSSTTFTARSGVAFSAGVVARDPNGSALSYTLSGGPAGLAVTAAGNLAWANPVKGSYVFTITAKDALGVSGSAKITLTVS